MDKFLIAEKIDLLLQIHPIGCCIEILNDQEPPCQGIEMDWEIVGHRTESSTIWQRVR